VHDEANDWPELRALLELRPPVERGLVLPTGGVALVTGGEAFALAGAPELRGLAPGGEWRVSPLPAV
jgi:hypothetical protein